MITCPNCGSSFLRVPAPRWYDRLPGMAHRRVCLRCWHCGWKGRAEDLNQPVPEAATPPTTPASGAPGQRVMR